MKKLLDTLQSTVKIRFQDCDPFNHLNNAAYLNYFVNARDCLLYTSDAADE